MTTYTPKEFAAHLATTGQRINPEATKCINRAAIQIRDGWFHRARKANPPGGASASYPFSIKAHYAKITNGEIKASIDTDGGSRKSQSHFGSILEYGGVNNAPQKSNLAALKDEEPKLKAWLAKIAKDAI